MMRRWPFVWGLLIGLAFAAGAAFAVTNIPYISGTLVAGNCLKAGTDALSVADAGGACAAAGASVSGNNTWTGTNTFNNTVTLTTVNGSVNAQTGTTYTLAATDCGKLVTISNAAAITLTTLNSLPAGCSIAVEQLGAGQVTVTAGSGATQHSVNSFTKTKAQYAIIGLTVDSNGSGTAADFIITGDGA